MTLTNPQRDFIRINKTMLLKLVEGRLNDCLLGSVVAPTIEEREKARLLALEYQSHIDTINDLLKKKKDTKDFSGI